jgi:hypothetical protein
MTADHPHFIIVATEYFSIPLLRGTLKMLNLDKVDMTEVFQFPTTKRELLDKLQVRVLIFSDRAEIKAVFPIAPSFYQKCTSP